MTALVALLEGVSFALPVNGQSGFVSVSRHLKLWSDVPKSQRPALFIAEHREQQSHQNEALPAKTTLSVLAYVASNDLPAPIPAETSHLLQIWAQWTGGLGVAVVAAFNGYLHSVSSNEPGPLAK